MEAPPKPSSADICSTVAGTLGFLAFDSSADRLAMLDLPAGTLPSISAVDEEAGTMSDGAYSESAETGTDNFDSNSTSSSSSTRIVASE